MTLTARPPRPKSDLSEREIQARINKGGTPSVDRRQEGPEQVVNMRVPRELLDQIDEARATRRIKTSRHTWLMEAVVEKLDREARKE